MNTETENFWKRIGYFILMRFTVRKTGRLMKTASLKYIFILSYMKHCQNEV